LAVEFDRVVALDEGGEPGDLAVHAHPPRANQLLCAAPRSDAGAREVRVQSHGAIIGPGKRDGPANAEPSPGSEEEGAIGPRRPPRPTGAVCRRADALPPRPP